MQLTPDIIRSSFTSLGQNNVVVKIFQTKTALSCVNIILLFWSELGASNFVLWITERVSLLQ